MDEGKIGILGYNVVNDRFGILIGDLWEDEGLHCGETFEVWHNEEWIADRIEKSGEWYLVFSGLKGDKLEGVKVRIND
jgi:hypothetical protein